MHAVLASPGRGLRRMAVLAAVICLAITALGAAAQSASASATCASSWGLSAYTWGPWMACGTTTRAQFMRADYNGTGTVPVCEQTQGYNVWGYPNDPNWYWKVISEICANNHAQSGDLSINYWGISKQMRVLNNSGFTHTIWGSEYDI